MRLCAGKDVTRNIAIRQPDTLGTPGKVCADLSEIVDDGWSGYGTAPDVAVLYSGESDQWEQSLDQQIEHFRYTGKDRDVGV